MTISKFWKTLDELVEAATDRREWQSRLGDEWDQLSSLLMSSGLLATNIACPSPGGDGCPRRVVRHDDGSIRAICGDRPKACRDLHLSKDDVRVMRLDRGKLASVVARAFGLANVPRRFDQAEVTNIGTHDLFAGRSVPVFLWVPGPLPCEDIQPFTKMMASPGPKVLFVPTARSVPELIAGQLDKAHVTALSLEDCVYLSGRNFEPVQAVETIFEAVRTELQQPSDTAASNLTWVLPADASWSEMTFRFIADEVVNITFRGETRRFEPDQLGMKSAKNGKPKAEWTYLKAFALAGGRLPLHRANPLETPKHQKQKQSLSKSLRAAFGISDDPIQSDGEAYVSGFVISAEDLQQGKQGQHQRNFGEPR
jgi:hypothetical protein